MPKTVNELLRDSSIKHSIYVTRYTTGVVKQMLALINKTDQDILRRLRSMNLPGARTPYQRARLEKLLSGLRGINEAGYGAFNAALRKTFISFATYELDFMARQIEAAIVVDFEAVVPAAGTVYSAAMTTPMQGKYFKNWMKDLEANKIRAINDAIRIGVVEGETNAAIVSRLRGTRAAGYKNGVMGIHRRHAEAIVRTSVNHLMSTARRNLINKNTDVLAGWQYVATLDGRTTDICMSLDGNFYKVRAEGPTPPQHINCRSAMSPVTKSWKEMGIDKEELTPAKRASMSGPVPAKTTYQTWLKGQGNKFQNDVLGKTKAQLFRDGGVTLDRFVDASGRSYTLAQLAAREAQAFAAIGG